MSLLRRTISLQPLLRNHVAQQRLQQPMCLAQLLIQQQRLSRLPFSTIPWRLQQQHSQQYQFPPNQPQPVFEQYSQQPPPPPKRSLPSRIILTTLKYTLIAIAFSLTGALTSLYLLGRQRPEIAALTNNRRTPSNAETLSLYEPPDATAAAVDTHIRNHPIAIALRENADFVESRPHMKMPAALRPTNLTGGTLAGPGRIAVPPLMFNENGGKSMVSIFYLGEQLCGHPGIIHGGLLATLLDEGLARCCFPALPNKVAVTANLKIDYRKPAKADGYFVLRAETTKVEGRKAWVKGWIERLGEEGEEPVKCVEAEALYIEPRNVAVMKKLYDPGEE